LAEANSATGMAPCCRCAVTRSMAGDGKVIRVAWGQTLAVRSPVHMASSAPAVHRPAGPTISAPVTGTAPATRSVLIRKAAGVGKTIAAVFPHQPATVSNAGFNLNV